MNLIEKLFEFDLFDRTFVFKRNEFIKVAGKVDTQIYFIEEGSIKVFISDDSEERIIRFGYRGNLLVSLDSFLTGQPSDFYIQAIKKTTIKIGSKKKFNEIFNQHPNLMGEWNLILEDLVLQQIEREKDLLTGSPAKRYQRVLERSPQLFQEIPNKHIANYLRMTPETLSRLKNLDFNQ